MSIEFDKTQSQYLAAANVFQTLRGNAASAEASLSFWIKSTQVTAQTDDWKSPHLSGYEQSGGGDCMWGGLNNNGQSDISWATGQNFRIETTTAYNDGEWHHILQTIKRVGGEAKVYIDGVLEDSRSGGTLNVTGQTFNRLGMLQNGSTDPYLDAEVEDVRIFDRALTAEEAAALAARGRGCFIADGLVSSYAMGEGAPGVTVTGTDAVKDDTNANACTPNGTTNPVYRESQMPARRRAP